MSGARRAHERSRLLGLRRLSRTPTFGELCCCPHLAPIVRQGIGEKGLMDGDGGRLLLSEADTLPPGEGKGGARDQQKKVCVPTIDLKCPGLCLKGRGRHRGSPRAVGERSQGI